MKLITSALLLVSAVSCGPKGPSKADTLVQVIEHRTDDFPQTHRVVVPLSARNSLGSTVDPLEGRRMTPRYNNCFFVVEQQEKGVDQISQKFTGSAAVNSEFAAVAASLGGELKTEDEVVVDFSGISMFGGYGIPNLTAPCGTLQDGSTVQVITEQIRAAKAEVQFSHSYVARLSASGGAKRAQAQVSAGWNQGNEGQVIGKDIVLTGRVDEVKLTVEHGDPQVIPDDVKPGTAFELPKSIRDLGFLVVQRVDVPNDTVSIRFQAKLGANLEVGADKVAALPPNRCKIDEDHALGAADSCLFWLAPGNAALAVGWVRKNDAKQLWATYYRTNMEPARSNVAAENVRDLLASH